MIPNAWVAYKLSKKVGNAAKSKPVKANTLDEEERLEELDKVRIFYKKLALVVTLWTVGCLASYLPFFPSHIGPLGYTWEETQEPTQSYEERWGLE